MSRWSISIEREWTWSIALCHACAIHADARLKLKLQCQISLDRTNWLSSSHPAWLFSAAGKTTYSPIEQMEAEFLMLGCIWRKRKQNCRLYFNSVCSQCRYRKRCIDTARGYSKTICCNFVCIRSSNIPPVVASITLLFIKIEKSKSKTSNPWLHSLRYGRPTVCSADPCTLYAWSLCEERINKNLLEGDIFCFPDWERYSTCRGENHSWKTVRDKKIMWFFSWFFKFFMWFFNFILWFCYIFCCDFFSSWFLNLIMLLHLFIILTLNFIILCNYITYMLRLHEFQHDFDNLIYMILVQFSFYNLHYFLISCDRFFFGRIILKASRDTVDDFFIWFFGGFSWFLVIFLEIFLKMYVI